MSTAPGVLHAALAAATLAATTLVACSREPLPAACPDLGPGDLVLSELRGAQSGNDLEYGEWIEVYNASGEEVDLAGVRIEVTKIDGSGSDGFVVRARDTLIAADGFAVFGRFDPGAEPTHVDYGYRLDFDDELYSTAALDLYACDTRLDRIIFHGLTDFGTFGLDGAIYPPSADANDDELAFCVDDALDDANPSAGARGTPGERNVPCE